MAEIIRMHNHTQPRKKWHFHFM